MTVSFQRQLQQWIDARWFVLLLGAVTAVVVTATALLFAFDPFYLSRDSALFQHGGWYIQQGGSLYVDIWDLKPPLIYAVTTLLAILSFGNMSLLHVLSVALSVGAVIVGVVILGVTVHRLTGDGFGAFVGTLSVFGLTSLYTYPFAGIRPKYFAFLCGVCALFVAVEDRRFLSGVLAGMAAGFWQLGIGIAVLVVGIGLQREGRGGALWTIAGGLTVAVITVSPFVLTGTATPLFVEVVIAPLYGVERYSVTGRLLGLVVEFGYAVLLIPIGVAGWIRALAVDWERYWWIPVGGCLYLFQIFLEFQGAIELVFLFVFLALGIGILVGTLSPTKRSLVAVCVLFLIVLPIHWHFADAQPLKEQVVDLRAEYDVSSYEQLPSDPPDIPSMRTIYWEKLTPGHCHYRLGHKQKYFEWATDGSLDKRHCGQWPFEAVRP